MAVECHGRWPWRWTGCEFLFLRRKSTVGRCGLAVITLLYCERRAFRQKIAPTYGTWFLMAIHTCQNHPCPARQFCHPQCSVPYQTCSASYQCWHYNIAKHGDTCYSWLSPCCANLIHQLSWLTIGPPAFPDSSWLSPRMVEFMQPHHPWWLFLSWIPGLPWCSNEFWGHLPSRNNTPFAFSQPCW